MTCFFEILKEDQLLYLDLLPKAVSEPELSLRLTSPSGEYSEWVEGKGELSMTHNVSESGDYEICIAVKQPIRIILTIYAEDMGYYFNQLENLIKVENITSISMISSRDEMVQQRNSFYIKTYVLVFCTTAIIVAIVQVGIVRGMFYVDPRKIRV
ncbi:hypothetical protein ANCDUO_08544 [Ancylostoma duodenale]|uniref:GOLD domain-containing protein n=1 Tax=Ancylostoma duodenale TaxID=51022 RepID=A0A0C2GJ06_9BILA|nr:hypothetical protein ANCDUO_08544 [Ancylostoma duodenale]